ncbi:reverse transcriptase domain-containing protein, partial [Enterobacter cloacae complex sp. 2DZ2F2B]|uniref:reverse transcriptase domain-containing protein n=1 Tax=Enterobacter cloacae complex sp. 2DZ2F2B TaxID=2511984 RepID=UPI001CA4B593
MLSNAQLPNGFWAEAVSTAVHLVNRSPSKVLHKDSVPEMVWSGKMPSYKVLRVFGYEAYTHVPKEFRNKLEPKSRKCIFLGYGNSGEMGYRLWDPESRKVVHSNDVHFNESKYHSKPERVEEIRRVVFQEDGPARARQNVRAQEEQGQDRVEPQVVAEPEPPIVSRSGRVTRPPDRFVPSMNYVMLTDCNEPSCYKEAVQMKDSGNWQLAMQSEMTALHKNKTWKLVKLPQGKKALPCKWVYRYKITAHDSQPKYKARLVAKGFKQEQGIDFDEVFSPV